MNWSSWSDFLAMGGYAFYVWGSLLMTAVVLVGELVQLRLRSRTARDEVRWSQRLNAQREQP